MRISLCYAIWPAEVQQKQSPEKARAPRFLGELYCLEEAMFKGVCTKVLTRLPRPGGKHDSTPLEALADKNTGRTVISTDSCGGVSPAQLCSVHCPVHPPRECWHRGRTPRSQYCRKSNCALALTLVPFLWQFESNLEALHLATELRGLRGSCKRYVRVLVWIFYKFIALKWISVRFEG